MISNSYRTRLVLIMIAVAVTAVFVLISSESKAQAQSEFLTEDQLQKSFKKAVSDFESKEHKPQPAAKPEEPAPVAMDMDEEDKALVDMEWLSDDAEIDINRAVSVRKDVSIISEKARQVHDGAINNDYAEIGDISLAVDMDNTSIRTAVAEIVKQASDKVGPWEVKWRLSKDNSYLLDERVNLTAEANFKNFIAHLVDKVNNMTGIQLFVTSFASARIIVISDTY